MKKITLHDETTYFFATFLLALAVALCTISNLGVSMIVAPAYILSLKFDWLTFGYAEYIVQGILIILLCLILRKVKVQYLFSFVTCLIYGFMLDLIMLIPIFKPEFYGPDGAPLFARILFFSGGVILTGISIALIIRTYLPPQVYDFFSKKLSQTFKLDFFKVKLCFDFCCIIVSFALTFILFGRINGIGIGTIILAFINSLAIKLAGMLIDKLFTFKPFSQKLANWFNEDIQKSTDNE